jgi:hypothetical protein
VCVGRGRDGVSGGRRCVVVGADGLRGVGLCRWSRCEEVCVSGAMGGQAMRLAGVVRLGLRAWLGGGGGGWAPPPAPSSPV